VYQRQDAEQLFDVVLPLHLQIFRILVFSLRPTVGGFTALIDTSQAGD
jgi:hypothetical protein